MLLLVKTNLKIMRQFAKPLLLFLILFISFASNSQSNIEYGRTYNDRLPKEFQLDVPELREHIYDQIPEEYKSKRFNRSVYRYSSINAISISQLIASGLVYSDWPELENYFNEILQKVMPTELKKDSIIQVYIFRDASVNAFMTPSGQAFINIGLLTWVENESELASVIAHELAHRMRYHSLQDFINSETDAFNSGLFISERKKTEFSVNQELEADSLSMVWLKNAGYSLSGSLNSFRTLERIKVQAIRRQPRRLKFKRTTHPTSTERLEQLNTFMESNSNTEGKNYLISESKFQKFQKEAKSESLKILLNDFEYNSCLESAFRFHLFDPNNIEYIYYMLESIRRKCYLDPSSWSKNFITSYYYEHLKYGEDGSKVKKINMEEHLFDSFDREIMAINPRKISKIKARFYWQDSPKFTTYNEAYNFFYKVAEILNCKECVLSNALSLTEDPKKMTEALKVYISQDSIAHRTYAQKLLNGNIKAGLSNKKLLIFNEFDAYVRQGQETIPITIQSDYKDDNLVQLYDSVVTRFKNRTPLFLPSLKQAQLNDYLMLDELETFSMHATVSKGQRAELYILDPRFLDMFARYGVNEIEFVNCRYGEYRKAEEGIDSYQDVLNTTYDALFKQSKRTRFLETQISSLVMIEGLPMKIRWYSGESKLKFNQVGQEAIIQELRQQIRYKELKSEKLEQLMHREIR